MPTTKRKAKTPASMDDYLRGLEPEPRKVTRALRQIILDVNPRITEEIKWAAPSFALDEHFVTFNAWAQDCVQLIIHHGVKTSGGMKDKMKDRGGLLEWLAPDRASMKFYSMGDVRADRAALQSILRQWIKAMKSDHPTDRTPLRRQKSSR